jgi:hypothetical protein
LHKEFDVYSFQDFFINHDRSTLKKNNYKQHILQQRGAISHAARVYLVINGQSPMTCARSLV